MNIAESIAVRKSGAAKLLSLPLEPAALIRARAAANALEELPADLSAESLNDRISSAAIARNARRIHSAEWIKADAAFDVLVAIEEDINPTELDEMGKGSFPAGAAGPV